MLIFAILCFLLVLLVFLSILFDNFGMAYITIGLLVSFAYFSDHEKIEWVSEPYILNVTVLTITWPVIIFNGDVKYKILMVLDNNNDLF